MSTPWPVIRFVRWRVRDWASCFLALDDEQETFKNSSSKPPIRNMVFGVKKDSSGGGNKRNKKLSKKNKKFRQVNPGSKQVSINSSVSVQNCISRESSRPHFQDEEYIVFCFGEDGDFDVVKERKSSEVMECFDTANYTSPRSVNRKHHCVEVSETIRKSSLQKSNIVNEHEKERTPVKKDGEEAGSHLGPEPPCNAITRWCQIGESDNCGTLSTKSSDSNQSGGSSTGSFSFPVMHWELIGSPVQMPKSENLYAKKHQAHCARFQCCRF